MLKVSDNFEAMIDEKLSSLEIWVKKIEKSNKPYYIPPDLLSIIRKYVQEAYIYDFDLIVSLNISLIAFLQNKDEFPFFQQISPKMQTELINTIFKDFQRQFKHFFDYCERGFINQLVVNLHQKIVPPEKVIISYGQKVNEIYFIREGGVNLRNRFQSKSFMFLPQYSVFGDYQILCDLKSNIVFKAAKLSFDTKMMCINKKKFMEIGELFPVTMENLR